MNYGRTNTSKRRSQIQSKAILKKRRRRVRLFKSILIVFLILFVLCAIAGGIVFKKIIDDTPKITADDLKPSAFTTTAYAEDGTTVIGTFVDAGSNRVYTSIDEIPKNLQEAFIAIEDSRFYEHNGIDIKGILRSVYGIFSSGGLSGGGSTITQQLIKNSVFPNFIQETTWEKIERKIQEQYLALQIEKQMEKDEILENYLNTINLGQNTLGVQAASKRYFGKDVGELTLSECTVIAAITQNPTGYNPITNPEKNAERRKKVLNDMHEQGYISQDEMDEALADNVYERIQTVNTQYTENYTANSYFIDEVSKAVIKDLVNELGYTETQAHNAVYSGGLSIITTQDPSIQTICEEELNNPDNYPSKTEWGVTCAITIHHEDGTQSNYDHYGLGAYVEANYSGDHGVEGVVFASKEEAEEAVNAYIQTLLTSENDTVDKRVYYSPQPQASITVIEQSTGHVKAIVGGRGEKTENMSLNRATQSERQPGSCFKVLSTYVPALDVNGDTLATIIEDSPYSYTNGTPVKNWWGNSYKGNMTIRECIEQSANVCTVKKFAEITPALGYQYLTENFAFTTLNPSLDIVLPACLGGISSGVTNLEMTAAYASIANDGVYMEPIFYTKILDHDGNVLYENTPDTHVAMKASTAELITDAMVDVMTSGTGTAGRISQVACAGKTGTTTNNKDYWLSAFTPFYTASVWTGYDDGSLMEGSRNIGGRIHQGIWKKVMQRIHADYKYTDFEMTSSIERKTICAETGKLASSSGCKAYTEYFAKGTAPSQVCPGHIVETPAEEPKQEDATTNTESGTTTPDTNTGATTPGTDSGTGTTTPDANTGTTTPGTDSGTGTPNTGTETATQ